MAKKYENVEKVTELLGEKQLGQLQKRISSTEKSLAEILKKLSALEADKSEKDSRRTEQGKRKVGQNRKGRKTRKIGKIGGSCTNVFKGRSSLGKREIRSGRKETFGGENACIRKDRCGGEKILRCRFVRGSFKARFGLFRCVLCGKRASGGNAPRFGGVRSFGCVVCLDRSDCGTSRAVGSRGSPRAEIFPQRAGTGRIYRQTRRRRECGRGVYLSFPHRETRSAAGRTSVPPARRQALSEPPGRNGRQTPSRRRRHCRGAHCSEGEKFLLAAQEKDLR